LSVEERSNRNVFNATEKEEFDRRSKHIGKALSQQSDRDLPRTYFSTGITDYKKKNGHEMQGIVLNIMVVMLSDKTRYKNLMEDYHYEGSRLSNWVLLLERLLLVEEFLRTSTFKRKHIEIFSKYFPSFLQYMKQVVNRQEGAGFKFLKFHLCTHFASDILKWGPPCCYNSSTGESNHKSLKMRSRKTQRQVDLIEEQSGVRYVEQLAINHSLNIMMDQQKIRKDSASGQKLKKCLNLSGLSYCQTKDGIFCVHNGYISDRAKWNAFVMQNTLSSILSKVIPFLSEEKNIPIYTRLTVGENQIYHADPSFKESIWQDWANCDWGDEGIIPVHILIFVDLMDLKCNNLTIGDINIPGPDQYAIVHMIEFPLEKEIRKKNSTINFKTHPRSILFHTASKFIDKKTAEPAIAFIPISSIHSPCIAIPLNMAEQNQPHSFLFLQSKTKWNALFVKSMKASIQKPKFELY
jgi:hypothetical protein